MARLESSKGVGVELLARRPRPSIHGLSVFQRVYSSASDGLLPRKRFVYSRNPCRPYPTHLLWVTVYP